MSVEDIKKFYDVSEWATKALVYISIINLIVFIVLTIIIIYGIYLYWKRKK